ncbi:MAG: hypothetical protein PVF58_07490 [Candidatus Methanofastidiosia archaeon]|jgi:hypothetical protein
MKEISRPIRETILWRWNITPERVLTLKKGLEDAIGPITMNFYTSKFSCSLDMDINGSHPSSIKESNHMDILFDDTVIIQLFETKSICSGILYDGNMSENMKEKVEHVFQEQGYILRKKRDFRLLWKGLIILNFFTAGFLIGGFWFLKLYYTIKYGVIGGKIFQMVGEDMKFFGIILGCVWLFSGVIWTYRYKKTDFGKEKYPLKGSQKK